MEVTLALLADYANVTREGKLNLMGLFDTINAPALPWKHPQMQLALKFEAGPAERGMQKRIEVKLLDADGREKLSIGADLKVHQAEHGRKIGINTILTLNNLEFATQGDYEFHILINGETKKEIPLRVNYVPTSKIGPQVDAGS